MLDLDMVMKNAAVLVGSGKLQSAISCDDINSVRAFPVGVGWRSELGASQQNMTH